MNDLERLIEVLDAAAKSLNEDEYEELLINAQTEIQTRKEKLNGGIDEDEYDFHTR